MDVNELLVQKISNSFKKQYSNIDQKLKQREIDLQKRVEKENQIFNQKLLKAEESQKKQLYSEIESKLKKRK